jgi:hypothetical protein
MHGSRAALEQSRGSDCNGGTGVALRVAGTRDGFPASLKKVSESQKLCKYVICTVRLGALAVMCLNILYLFLLILGKIK